MVTGRIGIGLLLSVLFLVAEAPDLLRTSK